MLQPTESSVVYGAETKLLDLAYETAQTRNLLKVKEELQQGANIYYWLLALEQRQYLTYAEREKVWRCLIDVADVYDFPTAPTLTNQPIDINVGGGGNVTNNYNTYNGGTPFENSEVSTPSETIDTFAISESQGVRWEYVIVKDSNLRKGSVFAGWLSDGSAIEHGEASTADIGSTTDVVLSASIFSGNVVLTATVASSGWSVFGTRYLDY